MILKFGVNEVEIKARGFYSEEFNGKDLWAVIGRMSTALLMASEMADVKPDLDYLCKSYYKDFQEFLNKSCDLADELQERGEW